MALTKIMRLKIKNIFIVLGIILLSLFQFGLFPALSQGVAINLLVVMAVFILLDSSENNTWWLILFTGLLLDLFSPLPFGSMVLILSIVGVIVYFIHLYFFTNQSIYTIVSLGGVAVVLFRFFILAVEYFVNDFLLKVSFNPIKTAIEILIEILLFAFLFIVSNVVKRKVYYG